MKALAGLNKYLIKYKWLLLLGILFIIISNLFGVYAPKVVRDAFNDIAETINSVTVSDETYHTAIKQALIYAGIYMMYALLKGLFLFFTRQTIIVMSRYIEFDLKNEIYHKYQQLSQSFYRINNTGDLMNRISEDVSMVRMYLGPGIMYTINLAVVFIMVIIRMLLINAELTLYVLTPLPIMSVLIYYISKKINAKSHQKQQQQSLLTGIAQETFSGIRIIKAYAKENSVQRKFEKESQTYRKHVLDLVKIDALFMPVIVLLVGLSTILAIYIGGLKVYEGSIEIGNIPEFVIYVNMLTWPFASVGWVTSIIQRAAASQERINEFLNTVPDIQNNNPVAEPIKGEITLQNVSFTYPESGITALKNINIHIPQGQTLAIVGKTGSGKSTLAALITRLYDVCEGAVIIDGKDIRNINLDVLRSNIGYVPQEVFLFSDTIKSNISFGLKQHNLNEEKIIQAAKDADIYDNIMQFEQGMNTIIGERGVTLSGGQKQRISIARAIIREPAILVFDDCLSAVDTETEDKILKNLQRIMQGKTTLIISHRISSVKNADSIVVLHKGQVVEQGSHQELLDKKGFYFDLYQKQLLEEEKIN
jgi:ATP-binding cassette subfamily B protein